MAIRSKGRGLLTSRRRLGDGLCAVVLCAVAGCGSAKSEINERAEDIRQLADETIEDINAAKATGEVGPKAGPHLDTAITRQHSIKGNAAGVQAQLPKVEDKDGPLLRWAKTIAVIAGCVAGVVALIYFGPIVSRVVAIVVGIIPAARVVIPAKTRSQVKLDKEALDAARASGDAASINKLESAIAAARTGDKLYHAAWGTM